MADSTSATTTKKTCRRCAATYDPRATTSKNACRYHPDMYVCRPHPPDHYAFELDESLLASLKADRWQARFWDCCGSEDPGAPGCVTSAHVSYDE
ncbi:hypothetical protein BC828DRAFT_387568 [Blastocladiella britannica]|nr:hypothetical protein BC828DRAFT_387568 [Blastocladiella britannica]